MTSYVELALIVLGCYALVSAFEHLTRFIIRHDFHSARTCLWYCLACFCLTVASIMLRSG